MPVRASPEPEPFVDMPLSWQGEWTSKLPEFLQPKVKLLKQQRVLLPLCGKSVDMVHLARRGHQVVGVEVAHAALDAFLEEQRALPLTTGRAVEGRAGKLLERVIVELPPSPPIAGSARAELASKEPPTPSYGVVAPGKGGERPWFVTYMLGDFLATDAGAAGGGFDAAFDRGGIVAVEPALRAEYAASLSHLVVTGGRVLLVAVEHPPFKGGKLGPPFSLDAVEVAALFGARFEVRELRREDRLPLEPCWRTDRGCKRFVEVTYLLTKKPRAKGERDW